MKMNFSGGKCVSEYLHIPLIFCGVLATVTGLIYILNLPGLTSDAISIAQLF